MKIIEILFPFYSIEYLTGRSNHCAGEMWVLKCSLTILMQILTPISKQQTSKQPYNQTDIFRMSDDSMYKITKRSLTKVI